MPHIIPILLVKDKSTVKDICYFDTIFVPNPEIILLVPPGLRG